MNAGVSILIRAGDDLIAANEFLVSLVEYNSYKPIEILLWAKDSPQGLAISRAYLTQLFVRVLPPSTSTLNKVAREARYDNLLVIDLPTQITSDVLPDWLQQRQIGEHTVLLCNNSLLANMVEVNLTTEFAKLAEMLRESPPKTVGRGDPGAIAQIKRSLPKHQGKSGPSGEPHQSRQKESPEPLLIQNIRALEEQIKQIETRMAQMDNDLEKLERQYQNLPDGTLEKQSMKDRLEDLVLTSCRLLIELKDAQDNLHELRIRNTCGV